VSTVSYIHHFDADAIKLLLDNNIYVFALKSQDSDSDQLNDNGPNASAKANYIVLHDEWLSDTAHAVPFSPYFLNPLLVAAWQKFEREAHGIIIKAAEKVGIAPFNPAAISYDSAAVSEVYDLVGADKAVAAAASGEQQLAVQQIEAPSPQVVLQLKAAAEPGTQLAVIRKSAADFFQTSWVMPATELTRALKEQRDLKKQSIPLEVDRTERLDTSIGLWITPAVQQRLADSKATKVSACRSRARAQPQSRTCTWAARAHAPHPGTPPPC